MSTESPLESLAPPASAPKPTAAAEPQQPMPSTPNPISGPSPKSLALAHLTGPSQRQLVEALAEQQALSDDHPIWSIVAMLGAVVSAAPVHQEQSGAQTTLAQKSDIEALRTEIRALTGEVGALRSQTAELAAQVKALHATLDSHLDQIANVISGAANLNRKIPEFLEGLKAALLPRTKRP